MQPENITNFIETNLFANQYIYSMVMEINESELINRAKSGDKSALTDIVQLYEKKIYNFALRYLHNKEDAEDVLQETFISVIKAINSFKGNSSLSTWIYRIAANASLMKLRTRKRVFESFDEDVIDLSRDYPSVNQHLSRSPLDVVGDKELAENITKNIDSLSPKYRSVFLLRDVEGFSAKEVSHMLNMTIPAVKSNLRRARIALRDKLADVLV